MIQYPLTFTAHSQATFGIQEPWDTTVPSGKMKAAIPTEFEGSGGGFSPEDYYVLALTNCFVATFKVIAERSRVAFQSIEVDALLTVDRDPRGKPWMKKCEFKIAVQVGEADSERILRVLTKTSENCLVANSVKTETTFKFEIKNGAPSRT